MQVPDQRAQPLVEQRQILPQRAEVVAVVVPTAEGQRDAAGAGLDEATGGEELLHQLRTSVVAVARIPLAVALDDLRVLFPEVERVGQLAGGEDAEGLLVEGVEPVHHSGRIGLAPEGVDAGEQRPPIGKTIERQALQHHVFGSAALVGLERCVTDAEETGLAVLGPRGVAHLRCEPDERRDGRIHRAIELRQHRPERRPTAGRHVLVVAAGDALDGVVVAVAAHDGSDDGILVRELREPRKVLADLDAGDVGGDGFEFAADLRRGVHLQVEHVLMARSARQEDHDDRLVLVAGRTDAGRRLGLEHLRQRQTAEPERTDAQEVATRHAVAEAAVHGLGSKDLEHAFFRDGFRGKSSTHC